jgi:hypothetical protein
MRWRFGSGCVFQTDTWVFGWGLLISGLTDAVGDGSVQVHPASEGQHLRLTVHSVDDVGQFYLSLPGVVDAVNRMRATLTRAHRPDLRSRPASTARYEPSACLRAGP